MIGNTRDMQTVIRIDVHPLRKIPVLIPEDDAVYSVFRNTETSSLQCYKLPYKLCVLHLHIKCYIRQYFLQKWASHNISHYLKTPIINYVQISERNAPLSGVSKPSPLLYHIETRQGHQCLVLWLELSLIQRSHWKRSTCTCTTGKPLNLGVIHDCPCVLFWNTIDREIFAVFNFHVLNSSVCNFRQL